MSPLGPLGFVSFDTPPMPAGFFIPHVSATAPNPTTARASPAASAYSPAFFRRGATGAGTTVGAGSGRTGMATGYGPTATPPSRLPSIARSHLTTAPAVGGRSP